MHLFVVVTDRLCCCVRLFVYYKSNIHVLPTPKVILFTVKSVHYFFWTFCRNNLASVQVICDAMEVSPLAANSHCSSQSNSIVPKLKIMLLFLVSHFYWLCTFTYTRICSYVQPTRLMFLFMDNILVFLSYLYPCVLLVLLYITYILVHSSCSYI
jgi:hypothetical protein